MMSFYILKKYYSYTKMLVVLILSLVLTIYYFAKLIQPITEATKIRNSLISLKGTVEGVTWTPNNIPVSYLKEKNTSKQFKQIAKSILGSEQNGSNNFNKGLEIAKHLMQGPGRGDGVQTDTLTAYRKIMTEGGAYCADYSQVFNAIAIASGIPVREWGMTFDGFGGDGHTINEIYDSDFNKWIMIDSFYSFYVKNTETNVPLSVIELRKVLLNNMDDKYKIVPISTEKYAFKNDELALDYYRKGITELYLWWGNNVFSYDDNKWVRLAAKYSRSLEQVIAILLGVHPKIYIIETKENIKTIESLYAKRERFILLSVLLVLEFLFIILISLKAFKARIKVKSEMNLIKH
jgi:hypothetical protein